MGKERGCKTLKVGSNEEKAIAETPPRGRGKGRAAKATKSSCAQDFESARSTESAPEPLIMMAKATARARRWYSMPSPF